MADRWARPVRPKHSRVRDIPERVSRRSFIAGDVWGIRSRYRKAIGKERTTPTARYPSFIVIVALIIGREGVSLGVSRQGRYSELKD